MSNESPASITLVSNSNVLPAPPETVFHIFQPVSPSLIDPISVPANNILMLLATSKEAVLT